ncbi:MAG: helix-turn-helix transcriptional regulator [Eubacterium sp.]|nr:helix-turn-helix transcriptional regulator [Eubacterium sp.]
MTEKEITICERFALIRSNTGMKQSDFAKEITLTQGHVSDIENKRKSVSNRVMEIICLKYGVNKNWFKTGKGDMYSPITPDDRYASNVGKLQRTDDEIIINWVNAIAETSPEVLKQVEEFMKKILDIK